MSSSQYLIVLYEFGNITFLIAVSLAPNSIKLIIGTTDFMMLYLFIMTLSIAGLSLLWLFIPFQFKVITIYIVFPMVGFIIGMHCPRKKCALNIVIYFILFPGGLAPYSYRLVESTSPITGAFSCFFMLFYCIGEFASISVNNALIDQIGARMQPAAIASFCLFLLPIIILTIYMHRQCQQIQTEIIRAVESRTGKHDDKAEDEMDSQHLPAMSDGYSNSLTAQSFLSASSVCSEVLSADELREYESKSFEE